MAYAHSRGVLHRDLKPGNIMLGKFGETQASLLTLYQGWVDVLLALEAARRTGRFEIPDVAERRAARREALRDCTRLEAEMARLRAAAAKEKQVPRQVALNLELKQVWAARAAALARL